jgi:hypothetical protein
MTTADVVIYRGHGHWVVCDGHVHTAIWHKGRTVQCRCFCADPEFLAHGFTVDLYQRYRVSA